MKKKRFNFFRKSFLINQLMQLYSLILIGVISLIMIGLSFFIIKAKFKETKTAIDNISIELVSNIKDKDSTIVTNVLDEVVGTSSKYNNTYHFLTLSQETYFAYMQNQWEKKNDETYFPYVMRSLLLNYSEISAVDIVFDEYGEYLHADKSNIMGKKRKKTYVNSSEALTIVRSIKDPNTSLIKGKVYVTFNNDSLVSSYSDIKKNKLQINSYILNSEKKLVHLYGNGIDIYDLQQIKNDNFKEAKGNGYFIRQTIVGDQSVVALVCKKDILKSLIMPILFIMLIGLSSTLLLLFFLNKLFKKYSTQMKEIVQVTNQVSRGDLTAQVKTDIMELELKDLAEAINLMVINLNNYIEDIYMLEIKQKDAHMRALQAQINPHFLYNTLEYIRMYALSSQQTELADIVYAFSALLRNNITDEKVTSLKKELDFCEKYVYLYQMRYPESIAYHFYIDEKLEDLTIPKFIIQPLIENYFVHGIDFERQDNAISVKVKKVEEEVEISIIDNGNGMTIERINELNQKLISRTSIDDSIGISNVYERLKGYFGSSAKMFIEKGSVQGIVIVLKIKQG